MVGLCVLVLLCTALGTASASVYETTMVATQDLSAAGNVTKEGFYDMASKFLFALADTTSESASVVFLPSLEFNGTYHIFTFLSQQSPAYCAQARHTVCTQFWCETFFIDQTNTTVVDTYVEIGDGFYVETWYSLNVTVSNLAPGCAGGSIFVDTLKFVLNDFSPTPSASSSVTSSASTSASSSASTSATASISSTASQSASSSATASVSASSSVSASPSVSPSPSLPSMDTTILSAFDAEVLLYGGWNKIDDSRARNASYLQSNSSDGQLTFSFVSPRFAQYDVSFWIVADNSGCSDAMVSVAYFNNVSVVSVDLTAFEWDSSWYLLGNFVFDANITYHINVYAGMCNTHLSVDSLQFQPAGASLSPSPSPSNIQDYTIDVDACTFAQYQNDPDTCTTVKFASATVGSQWLGVSYSHSLGTYDFYLTDSATAWVMWYIAPERHATYEVYVTIPSSYKPYDSSAIYLLCSEQTKCTNITVDQSANMGADVFLGTFFIDPTAANLTLYGTSSQNYVYADAVTLRAVGTSVSPTPTPSLTKTPSASASTSATVSPSQSPSATASASVSLTPSVSPLLSYSEILYANESSTIRVGTWTATTDSASQSSVAYTSDSSTSFFVFRPILVRSCASLDANCSYSVYIWNGVRNSQLCKTTRVNISDPYVSEQLTVDQSDTGSSDWVFLGSYLFDSAVNGESTTNITIAVSSTCSSAFPPTSARADALMIVLTQPSVTPSPSASPSASVTPSISTTPSVSPSPSLTPSPSPTPSGVTALIFDSEALMSELTLTPSVCWNSVPAGSIANVQGAGFIVDSGADNILWTNGYAGLCSAKFELPIVPAGAYTVFLSHPTFEDELLQPNITVTVRYLLGVGVQAETQVSVDMALSTDGWSEVGAFYFDGTATLTLTNNRKYTGHALAIDAVKFVAGNSLIQNGDFEDGVDQTAWRFGASLQNALCTSQIVSSTNHSGMFALAGECHPVDHVMSAVGVVTAVSATFETKADFAVSLWARGGTSPAVTNSSLLIMIQVIFEAQSGNTSVVAEAEFTFPQAEWGLISVSASNVSSLIPDNSTGGAFAVVLTMTANLTAGANASMLVDDVVVEADECAWNNGGCSQQCTNVLGARLCSCFAGYSLASNGDCVDIDECQSSNGGCAELCTNTVGSFTCACNNGLELASDGVSCIANLIANGNFESGTQSWSLVTVSPAMGTFVTSQGAATTGSLVAEISTTVSSSGTSTERVVLRSDSWSMDATTAPAICSFWIRVTASTSTPSVLVKVVNQGSSTTVASLSISVSSSTWSYQSFTVSSSYLATASTLYTQFGLGNTNATFQLDSVAFDVNECAASNGGCAQTCTNALGSYACSCGAGYMLASDGVTCDWSNLVPAGDLENATQAGEAWMLAVGDSGDATMNFTDSRAAYSGSYGLSVMVTTAPDTPEHVLLSSASFSVDTTMYAYSLFLRIKAAASSALIAFLGDASTMAAVDVSVATLDVKTSWTTTEISLPFNTFNAPTSLKVFAEFPVEATYFVDDVFMDVNECGHSNGGCDHTCTNSEGSFACSCRSGYSLNADGFTCEDVNECATNNGGCVFVCVNTESSFLCECSSGLVLSADGLSCTTESTLSDGDFEADTASDTWETFIAENVAGYFDLASAAAARFGSRGALVVVQQSASSQSDYDARLQSSSFTAYGGVFMSISFYMRCYPESGTSSQVVVSWQSTIGLNDLNTGVITCTSDWTHFDSVSNQGITLFEESTISRLVHVTFKFGASAGTYHIDQIVAEARVDPIAPFLTSFSTVLGPNTKQITLVFSEAVFLDSATVPSNGIRLQSQANSTTGTQVYTLVGAQLASGNGTATLVYTFSTADVTAITGFSLLLRNESTTFISLGNLVQDINLNFNDLIGTSNATQASSARYDFQPPSCTVSLNTDVKTGTSQLRWTISFSETITFSASGVQIVGPLGTLSVDFSSTVVANKQYIVGTTATVSGNYTAKVLAGTIADTLGNLNFESNSATYVVDLTPPSASVYSTGHASGDVIRDDPIRFTFVFSEDVTNFGLSVLTLANCNDAVVSSVFESSVFVLNCSANPLQTTVTITGAVVDLYGNTNSSMSGVTFSLLSDLVGPIATFTSTFGLSHGPQSSNTITVTFDELVVGFAMVDLVFSPGTTGASASSTLTRVQATPDLIIDASQTTLSSGAFSLSSVNAWTFKSSALGCAASVCGSTYGQTFFESYTANQLATFVFTVAVEGNYGLYNFKVGSTVSQISSHTIRVVNSHGTQQNFTFSITNSTNNAFNYFGSMYLPVGSTRVVLVSPAVMGFEVMYVDAVRLQLVDATTYTFTLSSITSEGSYTVSTNPNSTATDHNSNLVQHASQTFLVDSTPPTVTVTADFTGPAPLSTNTFYIRFSEPMGQFGLTDISFVSGGTGAVVSLADGPQNYTARVTGAIVDGTYSLTILTSAKDTAGNALQQTTTVSVIVVFTPTVNATSSSFTDTNPEGGMLSGRFEFQRATDETYVTGYRLYFATSTTASSRRTGYSYQWLKSDNSYADLVDVYHSSSEIYLQVVAYCSFDSCKGDSSLAQSLEISDLSRPNLKATDMSFDDADLNFEDVSGNVTFITYDQTVDAYQAIATGFSLFLATGTSSSQRTSLVSNFTSFEIIVDNKDAGVKLTGSWSEINRITGSYENGYYHDQSSNKGGKSVTYNITIPCVGPYEISMWHPASTDLAPNVPVTIQHDSGSTVVYVDETTGGGQWKALGTFYFSSGAAIVVISNAGTSVDKLVVADAVKAEPTEILNLCPGTIFLDTVATSNGVSHLHLVAFNSHGFSSQFAAVAILDKALPISSQVATSVSFFDIDFDVNTVGGQITLTRPSNEINPAVNAFNAYLCNASDSSITSLGPLVGWVSVPSTSISIAPTLSISLNSTAFAWTHVSVFGTNQYGESLYYTLQTIIDRKENSTERALLNQACTAGDALSFPVFSPRQYWCSTVYDICHWEGVTCQSAGTSVTSIVFAQANCAQNLCATGMIPSELGMLYSLTTLNLANNELHGPLPSEIGLLSGKLATLDVTANFLSGTVPDEILGLAGASLELSLNFFAGYIPRLSPAAPQAVLSFQDTLGASGKIAGKVSVSAATTEANFVYYVVYLGLSDGTFLTSDIARTHKTGTDLSITIPNTIVGNATHVLVVSASGPGYEESTSVKLLIVDLTTTTPVNPPSQISFTDLNFLTGKVYGDVCFVRAADEREGTSEVVYGYLLFWATGPLSSDRVGNYTAIYTVSEKGGQAGSFVCFDQMLQALTIPSSVTSIHVVSYNDSGDDDSVSLNGAFAVATFVDATGGCRYNTDCSRGNCAELTNTCVCAGDYSGSLCQNYPVKVAMRGGSSVVIKGKARIRLGRV